MQSYGNYSYYPQPAYPQAPYAGPGPSNGYPAFNYPPAFNPRPDNHEQPFIPPGPPPDAAKKGTKKDHRRTATMPASSKPYPLKSALKKPPATQEDPLPANPAPPRANGLTRSRTYSNPNHPSNLIAGTDPAFRPHHMFLMFIGRNELRLENIMKPAMYELRQTILPMWPGGIEADSQHGHDWSVKFRDAPWTMNGPSTAITWKIIVELFTLFARRGFTFQTCTNTGNPPPRLIFEVTSQDYTSEFFLAYFSQGGRRLTLINPPAHIDISIGAQLKVVLPRKIGTDEVIQDNLRVVEVKKRSALGGSEVAPAAFLMHVLKIISGLGYDLVTAVPLGRRGPFGIRPGQELLVFRGSAAG